MPDSISHKWMSPFNNPSLIANKDSGRHTEAALDEIRYTFRNAQFFREWVVSENSNGVHNSKLLFRTLEYRGSS